MADVTLEMLQGLVLRSLDEQGAIRKETGEVRSLLLALVDQTRRIERRMGDMGRRLSEVVSDVELMVKVELVGRMGIFEIQSQSRYEELADRVAALERRLPG